MNKDLKILIIVFSLITVLILGGIGAGYYWWTNNSKRLIQLGKKMGREGKEYGIKNVSSECVKLAMKKDSACESFSCHIGMNFFLSSCLEHSQREKYFCKDVPKEDLSDLMGVVAWRMKECEKTKHPNNQACQRLMGNIQKFCFPKKVVKKS
jgi:hypothetical protein